MRQSATRPVPALVAIGLLMVFLVLALSLTEPAKDPLRAASLDEQPAPMAETGGQPQP